MGNRFHVMLLIFRPENCNAYGRNDEELKQTQERKQAHD